MPLRKVEIAFLRLNLEPVLNRLMTKNYEAVKLMVGG